RPHVVQRQPGELPRAGQVRRQAARAEDRPESAALALQHGRRTRRRVGPVRPAARHRRRLRLGAAAGGPGVWRRADVAVNHSLPLVDLRDYAARIASTVVPCAARPLAARSWRSGVRWKLPRRLVTLLCLLVLACASSDQLAQQSDKEMQAGHAQKAYDKAKKALQKDRSNDHARAAMASAAAQLMRQRQDEITALAAAHDTLAAADRTLQLDAFRRELADYAVSLPVDDEFDAAEHRIRNGAAGIHYRRGSEDLDAGQPKRAYDEFVATSHMVPGYKDVDERIHAAYEDAVAHIALLPFANETDVRGLSLELADKTYDEVARRINPKDFRFTVLLGRDAVNATVPVAALDHLDRSDAVRFGRELKANQVIVGRFFGLHSQTNTETYRQVVYRRVPRQVPEGQT